MPRTDYNILVAIRVRPLVPKEESLGDYSIVRAEDNLIVVFDPIEQEFEFQKKQMLDVYHRSREQKYAFDKVFTTQPPDNIFQQTAGV